MILVERRRHKQMAVDQIFGLFHLAVVELYLERTHHQALLLLYKVKLESVFDRLQ